MHKKNHENSCLGTDKVFSHPSEYSPISSPFYIYTLHGTICCIPPKRITSLPTNKHLKNVQIRPVQDLTFPPSSRGTAARARAYLRPCPGVPAPAPGGTAKQRSPESAPEHAFPQRETNYFLNRLFHKGFSFTFARN